MRSVLMKSIWGLVGGIFLMVPVLAHGEVYLKYRSHTEPFMTMGQMQPAEDFIREVWVGRDRARIDEQGDATSTLVDTKNNTMTILDHDTQTYTVVPLDDLMGSMQASMEAQMGDEALTEEGRQAIEMFKGMADEMMGSFKMTVTETGEQKKIGQWNTTKYLVETSMGMGSSTAEVWATRDIDVDTEIYGTMAQAFMAEGSRMGEAAKEMEKIKGVHVLTVSTSQVFGTTVKNTEELLEVKKMSLSPELFEIPAGYREERM